MAIYQAKMGILPASANALKNHLGGSPRNRPLNTCCDSFFSGSKFALMPRGNQPIRIGRKRSPNIIQCREFLLDSHLIYRIFHHWHSLAPSLYAAYYNIISHADGSSRTIRGIKTAAHRPCRDRVAASRSLSCPRHPDPIYRPSLPFPCLRLGGNRNWPENQRFAGSVPTDLHGSSTVPAWCRSQRAGSPLRRCGGRWREDTLPSFSSCRR